MNFYDELTEKEYIDFFNKSRNSHFMQAYDWGLTQRDNRGYIPYYVGVKNEKGHVLACAMLLKRKAPMHLSYFYSPRGFVLDYENEELFQVFTEGLKDFLKKQNAIYLRVDPAVKYQDIDANAKKIDGGENNYKIFDNFIKLGYVHQGFNKLYEGNQPRYTIRVDLKQEKEVIDKNISKTYMNTIKRSYNYDLIVEEGDNPDVMHDLILNNAAKDGFKAYSIDYYRNFYKHLKKYNHVKLLNIRIFPDKEIEKINTELNDLKDKIANNEISSKKMADTNDRIKRLEKDLEIFSLYENKYPDGKVICSAGITYTNLGAWLLYLGNDSLGERTFAVNRCYYEALMDAYEKNLDFFDLFGTVGDPHTDYKNLAGLHEFKRKFGGEYIEFLGEFDLIQKPVLYKVLPIVLKVYRKLRG